MEGWGFLFKSTATVTSKWWYVHFCLQRRLLRQLSRWRWEKNLDQFYRANIYSKYRSVVRWFRRPATECHPVTHYDVGLLLLMQICVCCIFMVVAGKGKKKAKWSTSEMAKELLDSSAGPAGVSLGPKRVGWMSRSAQWRSLGGAPLCRPGFVMSTQERAESKLLTQSWKNTIV